ncbi:MAG: tetratricopeptide repeat protein [Nitrospirota bacterium]
MLVNLPREKRYNFLLLGLVGIIFIGALIYSNILDAPFFFDDYSAIVDNDKIKNLKTSLADISDNRYLTNLTFAINYALGGLKPFGYHALNNLIHIINALLVYYLVILTFRTPHLSNSQASAQFIAFSSAFVFIAHPIQTQAVTYIAQRPAILSTLFYLLSLVMYVKGRLSLIQKPEIKGHAIMLIFFIISCFSAVLAMKSKEIAFTLPVIAVLYEFFFFNNDTGKKKNIFLFPKRFLYLIPLLLTMLIIPLAMIDLAKPIASFGDNIDAISRETANISRSDYLMTEFRVIITYLRLLIFPFKQSIDYSYPIYHSFFTPSVFMSFLLLSGLLGIAIYLFYASRKGHKDWRLISFGIFWFFITLSIESSIIPIRDVIFEHRLYLPSAGFFMASVSLIDYSLCQKRIKIIIIIVFIVLLSAGTYSRNILWKDPQALWEDVLTKFPQNVRANNSLGVIYKEQGDFEKAAEKFKKILDINSIYVPAYYNLGDIQYRLGNHRDAIAFFKKALELGPSYHFRLDTLTSLAVTYSEMGDDDNALETFKKAASLFPEVVTTHNNLGRQYIKMGQLDNAIEVLEKALSLREAPQVFYNLSVAHKQKGNKDKSKMYYQKAMESNP